MRPRRFVSLLVAGCMMVSMMPVSAVTAFAEGDTQISEVAAEETAYDRLKNAIDNAKDGDTIKLTEDVDVKDTLIVKNKQLTLDLNKHKLSNTNDIWDEKTGNWSLVSVRETSNLTITGDGELAAKENDCYAVDVQNGANLTIENGTFVGNIHAVYVLEGHADIKGGTYSIQQTYPSPKEYEFVLNLYDANRKAGTATMTVTGGTFEKFNPADCWAEGEHTNFCADGYTTSKNGDIYTVESKTYNTEVKVDVDENPDHEERDDTLAGVKGEPVELDVTVTGDSVPEIKALSLDFGDDLNDVADVSITKGDEWNPISLKQSYGSTGYKNMPVSALNTLLDSSTRKESAETQAENSIALFSDEDSDPTTNTDSNILNYNLRVTYGDNAAEGRHKVNVVFKAGTDENSGVVAKQAATIQIGTRTEDSGTGDAAGGDGSGAGAVIAGVAIGVGVAAVAYHAGVRIYADQVLGNGVAVPRTREAVALKAWELAGKPAVTAEGEPLSETAQAERWVVESGLMQNEADGSFNGQKKIGSLDALRTLDAAKKLG